MSEEITTPAEEEVNDDPFAPKKPAGEGTVLSPMTTRNLKGLVNETRRIKKLISARALENKPANDLEDVLESICEKILWCLEKEAGM